MEIKATMATENTWRIMAGISSCLIFYGKMNLSNEGTIIFVKKVAERTFEAAIKVPASFSFIAGQYIWLMIPKMKYSDSRGNTRMFSIVSSPNKKGEINIIFRISESGYKKTLVEMLPGARVVFSGPYGSLSIPKINVLPLIFVVGGVGVTPFLSIIRFADEIHSNQRIILIYANNNKSEAVYLDELKRMERTYPCFKLFEIFGPLRERALKKVVNGYIRYKAIWFIIGLRGFVNFTGKYLAEKGVSSQDMVFEQFYPDLPVKNG